MLKELIQRSLDGEHPLPGLGRVRAGVDLEKRFVECSRLFITNGEPQVSIGVPDWGWSQAVEAESRWYLCLEATSPWIQWILTSRVVRFGVDSAGGVRDASPVWNGAASVSPGTFVNRRLEGYRYFSILSDGDVVLQESLSSGSETMPAQRLDPDNWLYPCTPEQACEAVRQVLEKHLNRVLATRFGHRVGPDGQLIHHVHSGHWRFELRTIAARHSGQVVERYQPNGDFEVSVSADDESQSVEQLVCDAEDRFVSLLGEEPHRLPIRWDLGLYGRLSYYKDQHATAAVASGAKPDLIVGVEWVHPTYWMRKTGQPIPFWSRLLFRACRDLIVVKRDGDGHPTLDDSVAQGPLWQSTERWLSKYTPPTPPSRSSAIALSELPEAGSEDWPERPTMAAWDECPVPHIEELSDPAKDPIWDFAVPLVPAKRSGPRVIRLGRRRHATTA